MVESVWVQLFLIHLVLSRLVFIECLMRHCGKCSVLLLLVVITHPAPHLDSSFAPSVLHVMYWDGGVVDTKSVSDSLSLSFLCSLTFTPGMVILKIWSRLRIRIVRSILYGLGMSWGKMLLMLLLALMVPLGVGGGSRNQSPYLCRRWPL